MYKTNRVNHDFQIVHFLAGSCHTPDGAYALMRDLQEDRSDAIKHVKASKLREAAKRIRAERLLQSEDPAVRLEGEADIAEIDGSLETFERNYTAAIAELEFISLCIERLQPLRKYAHLPDAQSHEAAQQEEWRLELIRRAENYLITTGTISTDHYATMRMHPEFASSILPAIVEIETALCAPGGQGRQLLLGRMTQESFNIPKLLGA